VDFPPGGLRTLTDNFLGEPALSISFLFIYAWVNISGFLGSIDRNCRILGFGSTGYIFVKERLCYYHWKVRLLVPPGVWVTFMPVGMSRCYDKPFMIYIIL